MTSESYRSSFQLPENSLLTISDVARQFDLTLRTLRFYEERGMITPIRRGVTRLYDQNCIRRLQLILKGRLLGFTLAEIGEFLATAESNGMPPSSDLALSSRQLHEQLLILQRKRTALDVAIADIENARRRAGMAEMGAVENAY